MRKVCGKCEKKENKFGIFFTLEVFIKLLLWLKNTNSTKLQIF